MSFQLNFQMKMSAQTPGASSRSRAISSSPVATPDRGWRGRVGGTLGTLIGRPLVCACLRGLRFLGPRQSRANPIDAAVAIEQVVSIERDDLAVRGHEMNAGALHAAEAEIEAVHELHD